jgi:hypothetical protein
MPAGRLARFWDWCRERSGLLVGSAAYIAGLFLAATGFAVGDPGTVLAIGGTACAASGFALARRWVTPVVADALPGPGRLPVSLLSGKFLGFLGLSWGPVFAGIGAALHIPDLGAAGLGLSLAGFLLALLSEPRRAALGSVDLGSGSEVPATARH